MDLLNYTNTSISLFNTDSRTFKIIYTYVHTYTHVHTNKHITGVLFIRFIHRVKYSLYCGGLPVYSLVYFKYSGLSGYKPGAYSSSFLFCLFCLVPATGPDVN